MSAIYIGLSSTSSFCPSGKIISPFDPPWFYRRLTEKQDKVYSSSLTFRREGNSIFQEECERGDHNMTQLVGLLCEDRQKAIMISDRMATTPDLLSTFRLENKCKILTPTAMILYSGSVFNPGLITEIKQKTEDYMPVGEVAELLANRYSTIRKAAVESAVLSRFGFSSFEDLHKKQGYLNPETAKNINTLITSYNVGIDLLLAGMDNGAHIFHIGEPGTFYCYDEPGFRCIGSGQIYAESIFSHYKYSPAMSEEEALFIGFEAKKRAETSVGVGWETDAWIIDISGINKINSKRIAGLEAYYEKKKNVSEALNEIKKNNAPTD